MLPTEDLELDERKYLILDFLKKCSSPRATESSGLFIHTRGLGDARQYSRGSVHMGVQMPRYVSLTGMQDADGLLSKAEGGGLCLAASGH